MKVRIDLDDGLYLRLKVEAARRGRTVSDLVAEGVRRVLGIHKVAAQAAAGEAWFGILGAYGRQQGAHDMRAIRKSVAKGRTWEESR